MLVEDFNRSVNRKINKINKLLKEEYGFSLPKNIPSKKLFQMTDVISEEIQNLKLNGNDARSNRDISKNLLILEGLKALGEKIHINEQHYQMSGPYQAVVDWLGQHIADCCEVGDDFDDACNSAMREYRSSKWRFPDSDVEKSAKHNAIRILMGREQDYLSPKGDSEPLSPLVMGESKKVKEASWDDILDKSGRYRSGVSDKQRAAADQRLKGSSLSNVKLEPSSQSHGSMNEPSLDDLNRMDTVNMSDDDFNRHLERIKARQHAQKLKNGMSEGKVTEMRKDFVRRLRTLLENEVEQAESMVAAKGLGTDLQEMITKISRIQNETLPTITDQMRDAYGPEKASEFQTSTNQSLQSVIDALYTSKDAIAQSVAVMSGGAGMSSMSTDMDIGMEPEMGDPMAGMDDPLGGELEGGGELGTGADGELDAALDDFGGEPLGRATKESVQTMLRQIKEMQVKIAQAKKLKESKKRVS